MSKLYPLLWLLLSIQLFAAPLSIRDEILQALPKELTSISGKDTRAVLEKQFTTKIQKGTDKDALYLQYFDKKNDVTLGFKNDHFHYLYLEMSPELNKKIPKLFERTIQSLSTEELKIQSKGNQEKVSHESGKYIIIDLPKQGLKLEFLNNENKDLHSIIMWEPGKDRP